MGPDELNTSLSGPVGAVGRQFTRSMVWPKPISTMVEDLKPHEFIYKNRTLVEVEDVEPKTKQRVCPTHGNALALARSSAGDEALRCPVLECPTILLRRPADRKPVEKPPFHGRLLQIPRIDTDGTVYQVFYTTQEGDCAESIGKLFKMSGAHIEEIIKGQPKGQFWKALPPLQPGEIRPRILHNRTPGAKVIIKKPELARVNLLINGRTLTQPDSVYKIDGWASAGGQYTFQLHPLYNPMSQFRVRYRLPPWDANEVAIAPFVNMQILGVDWDSYRVVDHQPFAIYAGVTEYPTVLTAVPGTVLWGDINIAPGFTFKKGQQVIYALSFHGVG